MTKFGDKTVLHVHVQVTSSFSQPLYYLGFQISYLEEAFLDRIPSTFHDLYWLWALNFDATLTKKSINSSAISVGSSIKVSPFLIDPTDDCFCGPFPAPTSLISL